MNDRVTRATDALVTQVLNSWVAVPLLAPAPVATVTTWVAVVLHWWANADALALATHRRSDRRDRDGGIGFLELVPYVVIGQLLLDCQVEKLGSSLVLFGNLAVITSIVRGSWFPSARIRR